MVNTLSEANAMRDLIPEAYAKASLAMMTGAVGVQQTVISVPVSIFEIILATMGGAVGGLMLLRASGSTEHLSFVDRLYTIALSAVLGAILGPVLSNITSHKYAVFSDGLSENAAWGLLGGAFVPVVFGLIVAVLRAGRDNPQSVIEFIAKIRQELFRR